MSTAIGVKTECSRVHGGAFPHPAGCPQCNYEHRCDRCGNSKGYGPKSHLRHGPGRCEPAPRFESSAADVERMARSVECAIDRTADWLFQRIAATRGDRPSSGACGFASIDELRSFALSEATAALRGSPNIGQLLRLELAVRNLYEPMLTLCNAVERPHANT